MQPSKGTQVNENLHYTQNSLLNNKQVVVSNLLALLKAWLLRND